MLQSPHHLQTYPLSFFPMETRRPTNVFARTLSSPAGSDYLHQPNMGPPPTHHPPVGPGAAFKQLGLSPYLNGFCPCGAWGYAALLPLVLWICWLVTGLWLPLVCMALLAQVLCDCDLCLWGVVAFLFPLVSAWWAEPQPHIVVDLRGCGEVEMLFTRENYKVLKLGG